MDSRRATMVIRRGWRDTEAGSRDMVEGSKATRELGASTEGGSSRKATPRRHACRLRLTSRRPRISRLRRTSLRPPTCCPRRPTCFLRRICRSPTFIRRRCTRTRCRRRLWARRHPVPRRRHAWAAERRAREAALPPRPAWAEDRPRWARTRRLWAPIRRPRDLTHPARTAPRLACTCGTAVLLPLLPRPQASSTTRRTIWSPRTTW